MAYIQRIVTLEAEFNISAENEQLADKEEFANKIKEFMDSWLAVSHTNVVKVQDFLHDNDDKNEN